MSKRNYTRELRRAQEQGATIVCSVAPYHGHAVVYDPTVKGDPKPWRLDGLAGDGPDFRYSGRECQATWTLAVTGTDTPSST